MNKASQPPDKAGFPLGGPCHRPPYTPLLLLQNPPPTPIHLYPYYPCLPQ